MNNVSMSGYVRVSKAAARKAFRDDKTVRVVPCKYRPDNHWIAFDWNRREIEARDYAGLVKDGKRVDAEWCFNNLATRWTYYNGNYEMGYYPAFYLKDETGR